MPSPGCLILNLASDRYVRLVYDFSNQYRAALFCSSICGRPLKKQNDVERSSRVNPGVRFAIRLFVLPNTGSTPAYQTMIEQAFRRPSGRQ